jgi:L-alanine-DL-glutamate epimerase-like enolase superfamily enzyme
MTGSPLIIESIEQRRYTLPLDPPFHASWDPQPRTSFTSDVVIVRAGGFEGVGAGDPMAGFAGNEHLFIGQDAHDVERHARVLENLSFHYGRMAPLDVALWDLIAKARGEPLWRMLGGASGRVRVYASTGERRTAAERAESAHMLRDAGFPALKLRMHAGGPADDISVVRAVRDAVGDAMEILVDANQGWRMPWDASAPWDVERAMSVAEQLADLGVYWLEEPLDRHDYGGLRTLRERMRGRIRIAGGEGARDLAELRAYIEHGSLDVLQPDVAWSTGVLRATQIAAEIRDRSLMHTPHTWGDGIVLLANLHVAAACSNAPFVEYPFDPSGTGPGGWTPERRDFLLPAPVIAEGGWLDLGEAPGLGAEPDWAALERWRGP